MVWTADRRTLVELMSAASTDFATKQGRRRLMRAVVLRDGKLEVRETADPVPGRGELLIKPLSAAICASDVHYMDHPNSADRFVWDSDRDTVMGHEFIGEVVGHGPDCSDDFPVGTRVTSLPIMIRHGEEPLVIGHNPDAPGAFGGLMLVSEVMARKVPDGVPNDSVAVVDAFAVGEFYVRCSGIKPGELPLVIGAGAIGLSTVAALKARGVGPIVVSDYSDDRLAYAKNSAPTSWSTRRHAIRTTCGERHFGPTIFRQRKSSSNVSARTACMQNIVDSCEFMARVYVAGGWYDAGTIDCTAATHKGMTIQFGGGPLPQDWYGTLDAVAEGRLDPSPSIGRIIGLDDVPDAIDQVRKARARRASSFIRPPHDCLPGPVRQMGYVVTDLDQAMAGWLELGVGPWFVMRGLPLQADYRGEPCETTLSLAFANSGEMQIELIQQMAPRRASSPNSSRHTAPGCTSLPIGQQISRPR